MEIKTLLKRKKNIVTKWVFDEFFNFIFCFTAVIILYLGMLAYVALSPTNTAGFISSVKNTDDLEKLVSQSGRSGRLYADGIMNTGFHVELTETEYRNFGFNVGGAYVQTPDIPVSSYDRMYNIYFAVLDDINIIIVLVNNRENIDGLDVIDIYNKSIDGKTKADLISEFENIWPGVFSASAYEHVYVLIGGYPEKDNSVCYNFMIGILIIALLFLTPSIPAVQKFSYVGRQISGISKDESISFKKMCDKINEYVSKPLYKNGNQYFTKKYLFLYTLHSDGREVKKIDIIPVSEIKKMSVLNETSEEAMYDVRIVTHDDKLYHITIHLEIDEVGYILAALGF